MKIITTKILMFCLIVTILYSDEIKIPDWIPENKKVVFIEFVKKSNKLRKVSDEYRKVLSAKPIIITCQVQGDDSVYLVAKKHTMKIPLKIHYKIIPQRCVVKDGKASMFFTMEEPFSIWESAKDVLIVTGTLGIGILIGYLLKK